MTALGSWVMKTAATAIFCAVAEELTPPGKIRGVQRFICGTVMIIALLSPVADFDLESYSLHLAQYRGKTQELSLRADEISNALSRTLIQEKCSAYILDKAAELGLELSGAEVELRWSGESVWYPVAAEISGKYDERLSRAIEAELGIGGDRQKWSAQ